MGKNKTPRTREMDLSFLFSDFFEAFGAPPGTSLLSPIDEQTANTPTDFMEYLKKERDCFLLPEKNSAVS